MGEVTYTPAWQGYVLSNYLFYSSLVVHFLGFAHKFIHSDVALVLQMVSKVLEVFFSSNELLELIHNVDAAYHSRQFTSKSYSDHLVKHVPLICEQLQDWEGGLSESDADGSFFHERSNSDLGLFSVDEEGAYNLLQVRCRKEQPQEEQVPEVFGDPQALSLTDTNFFCS
jgi:hypothetical protein